MLLLTGGDCLKGRSRRIISFIVMLYMMISSACFTQVRASDFVCLSDTLNSSAANVVEGCAELVGLSERLSGLHRCAWNLAS
jgi:hypothetical protein